MGTLTEVLQNVTGDNPRVVILGEPSAVDLARLEALKDSKGVEVAADGTAEFNQYKVVGVRLKTRNGVPVMRMEAHTAYDELKAKADAENSRIDANAVFASPIAKKHSKPCSELVTYEYLLQTI